MPEKIDSPLSYYTNLNETPKKPLARGSLLDLRPKQKAPKNTETDKYTTRGDRKKCMRFSNRSARSMAQLLSSLVYEEAFFVTLTQRPGLAPADAKNALHVFFIQLKRDYPTASAIWRLEKQKCGSPHFHILIFGITLADLYQWDFSQQWGNKINATDYLPRCDCQIVTNTTGMYLYLAGHSTKRSQTWAGQPVGRYWGVHNRQNLPIGSSLPFDLEEADLEYLRREWESNEQQRIAWLNKKYNIEAFPRGWEMGNLKFFTRSVEEILKERRKNEKNA